MSEAWANIPDSIKNIGSDKDTIENLLGNGISVTETEKDGKKYWETGSKTFKFLSDNQIEELEKKGFSVEEKIFTYDGGAYYSYKIEKNNSSNPPKNPQIKKNNENKIKALETELIEMQKKMKEIEKDGINDEEIRQIENLEKTLETLKNQNKDLDQNDLFTKVRTQLDNLQKELDEQYNNSQENEEEKKPETVKELFEEVDAEKIGKQKKPEIKIPKEKVVQEINTPDFVAVNNSQEISEEQNENEKLKNLINKEEELSSEIKKLGENIINEIDINNLENINIKKLKEFSKEINILNKKCQEYEKYLCDYFENTKIINLIKPNYDVKKDYLKRSNKLINRIIEYSNKGYLNTSHRKFEGKQSVVNQMIDNFESMLKYFDINSLSYYLKRKLNPETITSETNIKPEISEEKVVQEIDTPDFVAVNNSQEILEETENIQETQEEYFIEVGGKKIITDIDGNPLNSKDKKNIPETQNIVNPKKNLAENTEKINKIVESGNAEIVNLDKKYIMNSEEKEELQKFIEKSGDSKSAIEKFFEALKKFFSLISGRKIDFSLDEKQNIILKDKLNDFDLEIFNKKYKKDFENIYKNSGLKDVWIAKTNKSKVDKKIEEDFVLVVDTNGPNNIFVNKIDGQNYNDKNAKVEIFFEAGGNFERKEIKVSDLKNEVKKFNENYSSIGEFLHYRESKDGKVNIEDYKRIEKTLLNDDEKKAYLRGVKTGLITDVKVENDEVKFLVLGDKDYISKGEMLVRINEIDTKKGVFWEAYLNKLGIRIIKEKNKTIIDLPGDKDLVYLNSGKIYGKNTDLLGVSGINVSGLYTNQIILLAHAIKNNIDLSDMIDFKYDIIRQKFSHNKNLKDLSIFNPKEEKDSYKIISSLKNPFENYGRYKDYISGETKETYSTNKTDNKTEQKGEKTNSSVDIHKEQANKVFAQSEEDEF